ncbi:MAG: hypothetical protein DMF77_07135 [Acidobacteria bacterium]|nr:MAG: hypothetical protein DMF77_07135 [Acidobacteriota bacterium]
MGPDAVTTPGLPVAVHEFLVAPVTILLAFLHARAALGTRRAAGELLMLAAYGFALERVSMSAFGSHRYGPGWVLAPLGVPIAVALVWAAVISSALALAARRGLRPAAARALAAALFAVTLDLTIEPVAVRRGLWEWTPPGPWLGVPIGNFVGWVVIVAGYGIGAERWAGGGGFVTEAIHRLLLAATALAALVAVGMLWTLGLRRAPPFEGDTLAGRLGATPGIGPGLVLLAVATAFAAEAALLGDAMIGLVALGTALALFPLLRPSETASSG